MTNTNQTFDHAGPTSRYPTAKVAASESQSGRRIRRFREHIRTHDFVRFRLKSKESFETSQITFRDESPLADEERSSRPLAAAIDKKTCRQ
ncbi:hypothetical protein EVAR_5376_1 [Eumeta japonica]|uniref:Uncharacterized protein n=1 Tax=Eumeta variegata TaxID=151549 RepID=A0A4C1TNY6_EUMVA|nr:hypothetical protein EVAR_5376_1 [Eumeta japonica]